MKSSYASLRRVALAAAASLIVALAGLNVYAQTVPGFEAVTAEVPVGVNMRIELKLLGVTPVPAAADITVEASRIDMGPDGMATMAAPLKPVSSGKPGVLAYQTNLVMAGRWAFTITAKVKGNDKPIQSNVIFTAVEKKSEMAPAAADAKRKIVGYRNPMGLPDVSPVPKKDSMGMDYIPVYEDETGGPQGSVRLSPEKVQRAGVRTQAAQLKSVTRTVRASASVVADETRIGVVTAKFNGFVEELYVPAVGERVAKGQKLMRVWIESSEILQKQADLTAALTGGSRASTYEGAERNLRFFGFTAEAIDEIKRAGRPLRSLTFDVPRDGTVLEKPAVVGMRFSSGDTLFRTADLSTVWVMAQVSESDIALIREGQSATVTLKAFPNDLRTGKVALIYPELNLGTRTVPVRIALPNPDGLLRTGLYADVVFEAEDAAPVVTIPDSAVIDSGSRRVAFVAKGEGLFEPRDLVLGNRGGGLVEVRKGIEDGEEVVVRGNFLIDAESNLKAALAGFTAAESAK